MKKAALVFALLLGCNPKVKIVEKEKRLNLEITFLKDSLAIIQNDEGKQMAEKGFDTVAYKKYIGKKFRIEGLIDSLQREYDDLEMELKKY